MTAPGTLVSFTVNDGFLEGIVRGYRLGLISANEYSNLVQCEVLDDLKLQLQDTSYGPDFLADEQPPYYTTTIQDQATKAMIRQFKFIRSNSCQPLTKFLDYISYGYMIDNVVLLITGAMHDRNVAELKSKCHKLGFFPAMEAIAVGDLSVEEIYNIILIDTPLAQYMHGCLDESKEGKITEKQMEVVRNTLYKGYLEDFDRFCTTVLGGITGELMHNILQFEADRRSINITLNSFGTLLDKETRAKLYPSLGALYPEGIEKLALADEQEDVVKTVLQYGREYSKYVSALGTGNEERSLEDAFFEHEVRINQLSFEQQFHYAVFYSYFKLKEQEIRNILWIAECILQDHKAEINQYTPLEFSVV